MTEKTPKGQKPAQTQQQSAECTHHWTDATCTSPATCKLCGKSKGSALGHAWQAATCTVPKACSVCGTESGNALGHTWQKATCTSPETCTVCAATRSKALRHTWKDATFDAPKTCSVCGKTEGKSLSFDDISVDKERERIAKLYDKINSNKDAGIYEVVKLRSGVKVYYSGNGTIVLATISDGTDGLGNLSSTHDRSYYFSDGEIAFAFYDGIDDSIDDHRLYFYKGKLIRWIHSVAGYGGKEKIYHDLEFGPEYLRLEALALKEVASLQ